MTRPEQEEDVGVARRREIFESLVGEQDRGVDVPESRKLIAKRYGVTEDEVRRIEREGMDKDWPPL